MVYQYKSLITFVLLLIALPVLSIFMNWWLLQDNWTGSGIFCCLGWVHNELSSYLERLTAKKGEEYSLFLFLFPLLLSTMLFYCVNILSIAIFAVFRHRDLNHKKIRDDKMKECIDDNILNYLYGDKEQAIRSLQPCPPKVVITEMVSLQKEIIGKKENQIRSLFFILQLDSYVQKKIKSSVWYKKIIYIDAAMWMRAYNTSSIIDQYQYADNPYLQNAAQVAFINLDCCYPLLFLNLLQTPLPVWNQHTLYQAIVRNSIPVADFYEFLTVPNNTIVIFALTMIRLFDQKKSAIQITSLLAHPDAEVRYNAILTIQALKIYDAIDRLKACFKEESQKNKVEIARTIAIANKEGTLAFFKSIWEEVSQIIQLEILKSSPSELRAQLGRKLPQTQTLRLLMAHASDKRLNDQL